MAAAMVAVWRVDRGGCGGPTELVVAEGAMLVVVGGRLAEEGLHASMTAVVQHENFDDLLALNKRLGPQIGHTRSRLRKLLEGQMVGRGARC